MIIHNEQCSHVTNWRYTRISDANVSSIWSGNIKHNVQHVSNSLCIYKGLSIQRMVRVNLNCK